MRVLWLTHILLPDLAEHLGLPCNPSGGWVQALASALSNCEEVELAIAVNLTGVSIQKVTLGNILYYSIPTGRSPINSNKLPEQLVLHYQRAIEDFKPDIVHIHGTENFHGILSGDRFIKVPTVISIQGILDVCYQHYYGNLSRVDIWTKRTLRDWVRMDGLFEQKLKMKRRAEFERRVFATNQYFIGRTLWDKAQTERLSPTTTYYHCEELLRSAFYKKKWEPQKIKRHTIFSSSASYPLKGFHILIKAAAILKKEFPDISIRVPLSSFYPQLSGIKRCWRNCRSSGYAKYLTDLIREEKMEKHIEPLGKLSEFEMAKEFESAHVFVLSSFMENSPNSLGEAMIIGTPSVVSGVGGVLSMVEDEKTALVFPAGDELALAEQIRRLFLDDNLATRLSNESRKVAAIRHSKNDILSRITSIYEDVIKKERTL
jgi:glycosyltransferase involved in cell wall biosynthesis